MLEIATFAPHAPYTPAPRYTTADQGVAYPKTPAYNTLPTNPPAWLKGMTTLQPMQQKKLAAAYDKRLEANMATDDMIGHLEQEFRPRV